MLKPGDLLLPNGYLQANRTPHIGFVIEVKENFSDSELGMRAKVYLTNGITHTLGIDIIRDLFDIVSVQTIIK